MREKQVGLWCLEILLECVFTVERTLYLLRDSELTSHQTLALGSLLSVDLGHSLHSRPLPEVGSQVPVVTGTWRIMVPNELRDAGGGKGSEDMEIKFVVG